MNIEDFRKRTDCPQWIHNADIEWAEIDMVDGVVVWENGTWEDGIWGGGIWRGGIWKRGTWEDGIWKRGTWRGGTWENGTWEDGIWGGGTWEDGIWIGGIWRGGIWKRGTGENGVLVVTHKCKHTISYDGGNCINIGCKSKTPKQWEEWFASEEEYDTKRGTKQFDAIYKGFLKAKACIEIDAEEVKGE